MEIKKISKLDKERYKIKIDDEIIITYDNVILENNLLYKKNIDTVLYDKIITSTQYYNIYNKVVNNILKKRKSEYEIRVYLKTNNLSDNDIDKMVLKLKSNHLISDTEYCRAFIHDKLYLSKYGINRIKKELLDKNILVETIDNELQNIDNNMIKSKLEKLVVKRINSNTKYSNYQLKQKILTDMMNLGYDKSMIMKIIENNLIDNTNILEKEFEKLYQKFILKYQKDEVIIKLKQKLLYKGFSLQDIETLIQKKQN